jgi:uncharacterized protein (DUF302 family)
MSYGTQIKLEMPFAAAVDTVKSTFKEHGFGTLTEIDVRATLDEKIDRTIEDYTILGVCNPQLASRALDIDRSIGLLLPCTVVVRGGDAGTIVEALDPQVMVTVPGSEQLQPIADEAEKLIRAAMEDLAAA